MVVCGWPHCWLLRFVRMNWSARRGTPVSFRLPPLIPFVLIHFSPFHHLSLFCICRDSAHFLLLAHRRQLSLNQLNWCGCVHTAHIYYYMISTFQQIAHLFEFNLASTKRLPMKLCGERERKKWPKKAVKPLVRRHPIGAHLVDSRQQCSRKGIDFSGFSRFEEL